MKNLKYGCKFCHNKGWIQTNVYYSTYIADNTEVIERCDVCSFFPNDKQAAHFAYKNERVLFFPTIEGFQVLLSFSNNQPALATVKSQKKINECYW